MLPYDPKAPVRWCFDGTCPTKPDEYTREMRAREDYYSRYMFVHDFDAVRTQLLEIVEVVSVTALCREVGISRPYVTSVIKGERKQRAFLEPLAKLQIWLDKYHAELLRTMPEVLAKRERNRAAQARFIARRKAGVASTPFARALHELETCEPAALSEVPDTQLATIARKLVAEIKQRKENAA